MRACPQDGRRILAVQADEVLTVVGDDGALVFDGEAQHLFIGDRLIGLARVARGEDIVPESSQGDEHREGKFSLE